MYGFDENDQRVSVDGRPKRIKKYADLNEKRIGVDGWIRYENDSVVANQSMHL